MSTTARELLSIMKARLSILESEGTEPHASAAAATRQLVERLAVLPPSEVIQIEYTTEPLHAQYIRESSREVLAEVWRQNDPSAQGRSGKLAAP
jgi:hypothetical protein